MYEVGERLTVEEHDARVGDLAGDEGQTAPLTTRDTLEAQATLHHTCQAPANRPRYREVSVMRWAVHLHTAEAVPRE